jgi:hydroxymethylbilane synthase
MTTLRLGTRGSLLARTQSGLVANALERAHPGLTVEPVIIKTSGDQIADRPLHEVGGKGLFTKELELALLNGEIDFAVHSFKDVPVTMPLVDQSGLVIAAVPEREDPRDAVALRDPSLGAMPHRGRVGTGSLRRRCQILEMTPDVTVLPVRGNIDTRLRKLRDGEYDVVVLAMAGLRRTGLFDAAYMKPVDLLPAPGQGALALQCRRDDARTRELLGALGHPSTAACVAAERELVLRLNGDCHSPIAAAATLAGATLTLRAAVGARGGEPPVVRAQASGDPSRPDVVEAVFQSLCAQGALRLLAGGS